MDSTTFLVGSIGVALIAIAVYAIYMSFGAPSAELSDPFEDHED